VSVEQGPQRAARPEDLGRFFVERANAGDVEGLVALYEPSAVRPAVAGESQPALRFGDLALTSTRSAGRATAGVARRQPDGSWLRVIDQPRIAG
jgi:hypothetical protein